MPPKSRTILRFLLRWSAVLLLSFLFLEGLASTAFVAQKAWRMGSLAERAHTRLDPELGWVNEPGVHIKDLYGPGRHLTTNARGFRGTAETPVETPAGKVRIVCSGDSFTLGYGVGDAHTWCAQLERLDSRFETVNMGQGGYGLDQAYLWYRRDGLPLEHRVHLLTMITLDFERMRHRRFLGYGKPVLEIGQGGALRVANTPVPAPSRWRNALGRNQPLLLELDAPRLLTKLLRRVHSGPETWPVDPALAEVVEALFEELRRLQADRGITGVLVYLPTQTDASSEISRDWRRFVGDQGKRLGMPVIDLVPALAASPPGELAEKFIPAGALDFPGAAGHYTERGNAWAAEHIHGGLLALPVVREHLTTAGHDIP